MEIGLLLFCLSLSITSTFAQLDTIFATDLHESRYVSLTGRERYKRSSLYKKLIGSVQWPPSKSIETLFSFDESEVSYDLNAAMEADKNRPSSRRAAHCLIYARTSLNKPLVLVQLRWDGTIGFPGGFVKVGEHPVKGLNREITEELGTSIQVENADFMMAHFKEKLTSYLFAKEVTETEYLAIERNFLHSQEFGLEVLGIARVPLLVIGSSSRGLPRFLNHRFCSSAKNQLLMMIYGKRLISMERLMDAIRKSEMDAIRSKNTVF